MSTLTSTPGRLIRIACPCDLAAMREATRSIHLFLSQLGLEPDELRAWELIAAEAGNNAVEHAIGEARQRPIEVVVEVTPTQVELRVIDQTPGFDLPKTFDIAAPHSESGRGLFLMASLSDSLEYFRGRGRNCLVLRKHRAVPRAVGPSDGLSLETAALESTLQAMTEELAASYESLSAIFRFTSELNRGGGGAEFTERWLHELRERSGADWFALRLMDGSGHLAVNCTSRPDLRLPDLPLGAGGPDETAAPTEARAAWTRRDVWFDPDNPLMPGDPLAAFGSPIAGFVHPIYVGNDLEAILAVGRYTGAQPFNAGQVNIIHTIADFLGIQLRNTRIQEEYLRGQLANRELEIAANIQRSLLPVRLPEPPGFRLAGHSQSASQVGGDFFDVLRVGESSLLCVIADVMGKGVPAAMFAAIFRSHARARPELAHRPGALLGWLNTVLYPDLERVEMFITAQLVYLDCQARRFSVASAGHCPLLVAGTNAPAREISLDGFPLGVELASAYAEHTETLPDGARIVLLTDGLIEARDPEGALLGLEAAKGCLASSAEAGHSAESTRDALVALAAGFQGAAPASDDLTLLVICEDRLSGSNHRPNSNAVP